MRKQEIVATVPLYTLAAGVLGGLSQLWLLADTDSKGLLPSRHPALMLIWGLGLVMFIVHFLAARSCRSQKIRLQCPSFLPVIGNLGGAAGLCIASVTELQHSADFLSRISGILGLFSAVLMLLMLWPRLHKQNFFLYLLLCLYTIAHTICQYRQWSTYPQLMRYVFPLLGFVLVMLYCYYRACICLNLSKCRQLVFFNQTALFCCCLAIPASSCFALYLGVAVWLICDLYASGKPEGGAEDANS